MTHRSIDERSPLFLLGVLCNVVALALAVFGFAGHPLLGDATFVEIGFLTLSTSSLLFLMISRRRLLDALRRDAGDRARLQQDGLTGALSRRQFVALLSKALHRRRSRAVAEAETVSLLLVDLDHLKKLNDSFGHASGDQALVHLIGTIEEVFPKAAIGRLGGDEFAIMLQGRDIDFAVERANELQNRLRQTFSVAGGQVQLSASVGIACAPIHAEIAEDLLVLADLALYESKRRGRSCATLFDRRMQAEERHRAFIERELRAAILLDHLEVHYQPQVDRAGNLIGVEALARWPHPVLGPVSPAEFIPIAERTTLIDLLGEWVFRRVCRDLPRLPAGRISFNVSAAQLRRDDLVDMVRRVLAASGGEAGRFTVEITENVAVGASGPVLSRIAALRALGMKVSLDDFGTGHCNFNLLRTMPVDEIKIDRSYVRALGHDPVAGVFVTAVAETARHLNLMIVAEGVESEEELLLATTAGCTFFQGYLFARPMTIDAISLSETRAVAAA